MLISPFPQSVIRGNGFEIELFSGSQGCCLCSYASWAWRNRQSGNEYFILMQSKLNSMETESSIAHHECFSM